MALRISCGILTVLVGLGAVAICVWQLVEERNFSGVLATAGAAVVAAVLISASEIFQHMANYSRPALQKQIVRVLLMVPIYSAASFLSLALPVAGPYLDVVRELYEALTIYAFTWFVLAYLELDANLSFASFGEILASKPPLPHMWPLGALLRPWQMGTPFIRNVQTGVLNYGACPAGVLDVRVLTCVRCPFCRRSCRAAHHSCHRLRAVAVRAVHRRRH